MIIPSMGPPLETILANCMDMLSMWFFNLLFIISPSLVWCIFIIVYLRRRLIRRLSRISNVIYHLLHVLLVAKVFKIGNLVLVFAYNLYSLCM